MRAFIRKPHRKTHLAHLAIDGTWTTYCDLVISHTDEIDVHEYDHVGGITGRLIQQLDGIVAEIGRQHVCAYCGRMLMLMRLMQHDRMRGTADLYTFAA